MKLLTLNHGIAGGQRALHYLKALNVPFTKDPTDPDITHCMNYCYENEIKECPPELLQKAQELGVPVINGNLLNIKKDHIDDVFKDIFGYSIRIDPTKHYGMCAIKSSQNAVHGMKLIECPISESAVDRRPRVSKGGVSHYRQYQRFIDTRISADTIRDFRVVIQGGEVVFLMEKHLDYRSIAHPQKGRKFEIYGHKTMDRFFTNEEQANIQIWIEAMRCDWGEADILRDNSTGLMYIVDLNPIPGGQAPTMLGDKYIRDMAQIFKEKHLC